MVCCSDLHEFCSRSVEQVAVLDAADTALDRPGYGITVVGVCAHI